MSEYVYILSFILLHSLEINVCEENPCQNGGVCENEEDTYTCNCIEGFTGDNCDEGKIIFSPLFI